MRKVITSLLILMFIGGCGMTAADEEMQRHSKDQAMTLGVAQKEIRVGMSQADVAAALGSPNIVSKDSQGKESWIYDKIATQVTYSQDKRGAQGGVVGAGITGMVSQWLIGVGATGGAQYSKTTGGVTQTQKTLTIVIKFDENSLVENLSYHTSQF